MKEFLRIFEFLIIFPCFSCKYPKVLFLNSSPINSIADISVNKTINLDIYEKFPGYSLLEFTCTSNEPTRWVFADDMKKLTQSSHKIKISKRRTTQQYENFFSKIQFDFKAQISNWGIFNLPIFGCGTFLNKTEETQEILWVKSKSNEREDNEENFLYIEIGTSKSFLQVYNESLTISKKKFWGVNPETCLRKLYLNLAEKKYSCIHYWNGSISHPQVKGTHEAYFYYCNNPDECAIYNDYKDSSDCQNELILQDLTNIDMIYDLPIIDTPTLLLCNRWFIYREITLLKLIVPFFSKTNGNTTLYLNGEYPNVSLTLEIPEIVYFGQTVNFTCSGSSFLFSMGFQWSISFETFEKYQFVLNEFEDSEDNIYEERFGLISAIKSYKIFEQDHEIIRVQCRAPYWNSEKFLISKVVESRIIKRSGAYSRGLKFVESSLSTSETLPLSIQQLECTFSGNPLPIITWIQNGHIILKNSTEDYEIFENSTENVSISWLVFRNNSFKLGQNFACLGKNFINTAFRNFQFVSSPKIKNDINLALIFGLTITFLIILISIIVLISWRIIKKQREKIRSLTDEEVKFFRDGNQQEMDKDESINPQSIPYQNEYEIPKEKLEFDTSKVLGSGQFGQVFLGSMEILNEKTAIAIKTVKSNLDVEFFKAFLSEIKIMAYLGKYERIVSLLGACTENIKNREIYIAIELCPNGSLKDFLRQNREYFQNILRNFEIDPDKEIAMKLTQRYVNTVGAENKNFSIYSTFDLCRWSYEIAEGMEFISSKRIIHGDLACRNVLLTSNRSIKISDFGLSRQLCNYTNYVKKTQCPLPWKWMAIESLKDFVFSEKSDVWAYGVTIWEIFSLGEDPYPGAVWNLEFIRQLSDGLRNLKPIYSTQEIYAEMGKCWAQEPKERSNYTELKSFFYNKIQHILSPKDDEYTTLTPENESENDNYTDLSQ